MVQGYYTLEEASRILGMNAELLSQMAQKREVRAFADRGTWRFRTQDIEELARQRGMGSSPDLQLGDALRSKPHDSPVRKTAEQDVFNFSLGSEDQVEIGQEILADPPGGSKKTGGRSSKRSLGPRTPSPKPGSDSDVRLVAEGSDISFRFGSDSMIKGGESPPPTPKPQTPSPARKPGEGSPGKGDSGGSDL